VVFFSRLFADEHAREYQGDPNADAYCNGLLQPRNPLKQLSGCSMLHW
jgi:hypothetical protein